MATTDAQVEMNRRLYMGQQVGLMGVPIGKPNSPSPIRTRREIVPGVYGGFRISVQGINDFPVAIYLVGEESRKDVIGRAYDASELREAAHLFNQLAEVLEENK